MQLGEWVDSWFGCDFFLDDSFGFFWMSQTDPSEELGLVFLVLVEVQTDPWAPPPALRARSSPR